MVQKPNIVIYNNNLLPASNTFVREQAEALQKFSPHYVGARLVPGLLLPPERTLVINRWGAPGKILELPYRLWGFSPLLTRKLRRLHPALIHAHFGPGGTSILPVSRRLGIPLVVTFHGYDASMKDEYARQSFYAHRAYLRHRETLKREAQLFIAVSNFVKNKLLEQGFPPEKIVVHYIGVDTTIFKPNPDRSPEKVVLFVGRLDEKKGAQYLLQAMIQVQQAVPDAELVMVGDGKLRADLERQADQLPGRYRFLGWQPPQAVRAWMNKAYLLCAPSVTAISGDSEGLPTVVAEAQASGLPVVGTHHAGTPEAVLHGQTGFLVPEREVAGLATYIIQLLVDQALRQQFGQNGRERAVAILDVHRQAQALEKIYQQVLN